MIRSAIANAVTAAIVAGCSLAPPLDTPRIGTPPAYKEAAPWTMASPADRLPRDAWWILYGDERLNDLESDLMARNPDLAAALAHYDQAKAYTDQLRSGLFPSVSLGSNVDRNKQSANAPLRGANPTFYDTFNVDLTTSYELDLWGRVRNAVASGRALAAAAGDDLESARLSLNAQLVDAYVVLRGYDRDYRLLTDTVEAYGRALQVTKQRHDGGIAPGLDVARAQTQLDVARSQAAQVLAQRALTEHAIAALVGEPASSFSIEQRTASIALPRVPVGVPATLLQRRPDVAAAQRRMASANADIGVARAAYFPAITLDASGGFLSASSAGWLTAPNTVWAVGPALMQTVFDGGKRRAQVAQARAALNEAAEHYRSVALGAFAQVEDNLALLDHYRDAAEAQASAVAAAQRSLDFAMDRYRNGAINYLEVVTAQTASLQTQRDALMLDTEQLRASVGLIKALGGGWQDGAGAPLARR